MPLIVTVVDSRFAMPCAVMLHSMADNIAWTREAKAVVLDCGLAPSDQSMIHSPASRCAVSRGVQDLGSEVADRSFGAILLNSCI